MGTASKEILDFSLVGLFEEFDAKKVWARARECLPENGDPGELKYNLRRGDAIANGGIDADGVKISLVEEEGGGEGDGEHMHIVLGFTNGDKTKYLQIDGFYSSWDAGEWYHDEVEQVFPIEKTITVYEAKK